MVSIAKTFILIGIVFIIAGAGVFILQKFNIPLGRLPGDIVIRKEKFSFYFPIATCIVISIMLSIVFYLFKRR